MALENIFLPPAHLWEKLILIHLHPCPRIHDIYIHTLCSSCVSWIRVQTQEDIALGLQTSGQLCYFPVGLSVDCVLLRHQFQKDPWTIKIN